MKEIQALVDEINKTEKENEELAKSIAESKEKVNALFKRAVNKITALRKFGALGNLGKKEQIYPITFNQASDFDVACSKFAKPATGGKRRKSRKKKLRKTRRKSRHKRRKKSRHKRRKKSRRRRRR